MAAPLLALIPALSGLLGGILDMLDGDKRAQAQALIKQMDIAAAESAAQSDINKIEAGHRSLFVAGWRPFIGWICGLGFAYQFLVHPFLVWFCSIYGGAVPPSASGALLELTLGMLGLAAARSFEKYKGVSR